MTVSVSRDKVRLRDQVAAVLLFLREMTSLLCLSSEFVIEYYLKSSSEYLR